VDNATSYSVDERQDNGSLSAPDAPSHMVCEIMSNGGNRMSGRLVIP
jgi:hypothetical protein